MGDKKHSTVTEFFKSNKILFKEIFLIKSFYFAGSYRPYMFSIRKISK